MNPSSIGIIGGADGPTAIFVTNPWWLNWGGVIVIAALLIPSLLYALARPGQGIKSDHRLLNILEQFTRYGCMLLLVGGFGFLNTAIFIPASVWILAVGVPVLILSYWLCWIPWFRKKRRWNAAILAILPGMVFFLCGFGTRNWLLMLFSAVFTVCHAVICITAPMD